MALRFGKTNRGARLALRWPLLAAVLLAASPSSAQNFRLSNPEDLFAAFKAVCLDHFADSDAQIAAALAAPQDFEFRETGEDGTKRYWNERFTLSILPKADQRYCMVTATVSPDTSVASGGALLLPHLPKGVRKDAEEVDLIGWSQLSGRTLDSYFFVKRTDPDATYVSFAAGRDSLRGPSRRPGS